MDRQRRATVDSPVGPVDAFLPPPVVSGWEPFMGAVPALGERTASVLAEIGYSKAEVGQFESDGVVGVQ